VVYDRDIWWADNWEATEFGRDYDFGKSFFAQFGELLRSAPMPAVFNGKTVNCPYSNHVGESKDCYLIFASWECENVLYGGKALASKDSVDVLSAKGCEKVYEVVSSTKLFNCAFARNSENCNDCFLVDNCKGCSNCFGCVNLLNKSYHIFNVPYSKEEYFEKLKDFDLGIFAGIARAKEQFATLQRQSINRYANLVNAHNSTGDNLHDVSNVRDSYDLFDDVKDCRFVINGGLRMTDFYDGYGVGIMELGYECIDSGLKAQRLLFSVVAWEGHDVEYSYNCHNCRNVFGCIGLRNKEYCILNKQYTKEDYPAMRASIIEHMAKQAYTDKSGKTYAYGEFFPPELSPFAFNETIGQEFFPLSKDQALSQGFNWAEPELRNYDINRLSLDLPDHIKDVSDSILQDTIGCAHLGTCAHQCTTAFKIVPQELAFYREKNLALPRLCSNCRHYERLALRNPMQLWHRKCMCDGMVYKNTSPHTKHSEGPCQNKFETTFAPECSEIVYCGDCYQAEIV
jgi:hypothetical protein